MNDRGATVARLGVLGVLAIALALGMSLALAPDATAHVGDPTVYFEGQAGPFSVSVTVRTPGVVPGLAEISLRVGSGDDAETTIEQVSVRPVRWDAGLEGAPPADIAQPVRGEAGLYSAELWLMTSGSYSVYVDVEGSSGGQAVDGTVIVPVQSVASERLSMPPWLGGVLLLLGILLVASLIRIAGAGAASTLEPGADLGSAHRRRMRLSMGVAAVLIAVVLYGGKSWWDAVDAGYLEQIFETFGVEPSVRVVETEIGVRSLSEAGQPSVKTRRVGTQRVLRLDLSDERWYESPPLAPDHGKLMHMFLIRKPDLDVFAHLHPIAQQDDAGTNAFEISIPPLPGGSYQIYADVTFENGFAQTLTAEVDLPELPEGPTLPPRGLEPDPDDSYRLAQPSSTHEHLFEDGHRMLWQRSAEALRVDQEAELQFSLVDASGAPAPLETYMGMMAHAAVRRHDGGVFVHLHPTGTISMASQELFTKRRRSPANDEPAPSSEATSPQAMDHSAMGHSMAGWDAASHSMSLPYAFPSVGTFRVWVQVKSRGEVYTGVFDAEVVEPFSG